ncbi:unnamed protein product [Adineta ricciae]|uniref:Uncharacterized protein n=1 Tax=Adineta ricciae TaxID=249248 RepID=A0A815ITC8_ADIRI|nr:unnamed protein product [Adineta ricciae]CAF1648024.1 unnamed protein product [Adineta ricciae]
MTHSLPPSTESTIVKRVTDEKFVDVYTSNEEAARLLENGRTLVAVKAWFFVAALGSHSYSSGIHCIRIRVDDGVPFLGIRSRSIPPVPSEFSGGSYCLESVSTYGWEISYAAIINGHVHANSEEIMEPDSAIYSLTLNCDQRRLSLVNENTNEQSEMEVDIHQVPFPWCLFGA